MNIRTLLALCSLAVALSHLQAFACQLQVRTIGPATWSVDEYNPFTPQLAFRDFVVEVANLASEVCDLDLAFVTSVAGGPNLRSTLNTETLTYSLVDSITRVNLTPSDASGAASSFRRLLLSVEPLETRRFRFGLSVPAGQFVSAGLYQQPVRLVVTERRGDEQANLALRFEARVEPLVGISLVGPIVAADGASALIDLGELTSGKSAANPGVSLRVRSTAPYVIDVESQNNGALALKGGGAEWAIDYMFFLAGRPMFDSAGRGRMQVPRASLAADRLPLAVTVGEFEAAQAGRYSDVVIISVEPL